MRGRRDVEVLPFFFSNDISRISIWMSLATARLAIATTSVLRIVVGVKVGAGLPLPTRRASIRSSRTTMSA